MTWYTGKLIMIEMTAERKQAEGVLSMMAHDLFLQRLEGCE